MEDIKIYWLGAGWYEMQNARYERLKELCAPQSMIDDAKMMRDWNPDSEKTYKIHQMLERKERLKRHPMVECVVNETFRRFDLMMANVPLDTTDYRFGHCDDPDIATRLAFHNLHGFRIPDSARQRLVKRFGERYAKEEEEQEKEGLSVGARLKFRRWRFEGGLCLFGYDDTNKFKPSQPLDKLEWMDDEYCTAIMDEYDNEIGVYDALIDSLFLKLTRAIEAG